MRVIIYGLGAIGGAIAAALAEAGHDVIGIARGAQLDALRAGPLVVRMPEGDLVQPLTVAASPAEIAFGPDDAIILAMKTQDCLPALHALRDAGVRAQPIFCFQNGLANEDMALRLFPNVHGATVMMPATFLKPGEVIANGAPKIGLFDIGRYPQGTDTDTEAMVEIIGSARMAAFAHPDIMASKRGKLLLNMRNAVDAAVGGEFANNPIGAEARAEAEAVFAAAGLGWDHVGLTDPRRKSLMQLHEVAGAPRSGSSTTQSLLRGAGSVETDYLNGEIARLGRLHGVATPVNAFLTAFSARMLADGTAPGSIAPDDLAAAYADWRQQGGA